MPRPAKPGAERRSLLVADDSRGDHERRRWDCRWLRACETAWVAEHGGAQAKCLLGCRMYEARKT